MSETKPSLQNPKSSALLILAAVTAPAVAQTLEFATFSRGGLIDPASQPLRNVIVLGQPVAGLRGALEPDEDPPPEFNLNLTLGIGFIPCLVRPTLDLSTTLVEWVGADGNYNVPANWTPPGVPDNTPANRYHVLVRPRINDATPTVTLNYSPSISRLTVESGATIEVNANSGADRAMLFSGFGGAFGAVNATSQGLIQINATNANNDFLLSDLHLDQTGGGVLRATGSVTGTLRLISCRIVGGTIESTGSGQVEIYDSIILAPAVQGAAGVAIRPFGADTETTVQGVVANASQIRIEAGADLVTTGANATFAGIGRVLLASEVSSVLGGAEGLLTNGLTAGADHRIEGAGLIAGRLLNNGVVNANVAGQSITISVPSQLPDVPGFGENVVNAHVLKASAGGRLVIASRVQNDGEIDADGGEIILQAAVNGGGNLFLGGGLVLIDVPNEPLTLGDIDVRPGSTSTLTIVGSTVACDDLAISGGTTTVQPRGATPSAVSAAGALTLCPDTGADPAAVAVLNVDDSSVTAGNIHVCVGPGVNPPGGGELHVLGAGRVRCAGDFSFDAVQEADITWETGTALHMTGGIGLPDNDPSAYPTLEIGGRDLGVNPVQHAGDAAGFTANFQLEELVIGPAAHVRLIDAHDNGNRIDAGFGGREALYVRRLVFADGQGRLHLNGLHLYYDELQPPEAAAQLIGFAVADVNCDGVVDFFDIDPFLVALFNPSLFAAQYPGCDRFAADVDGGGSIDFFDIDPFLLALFD